MINKNKLYKTYIDQLEDCEQCREIYAIEFDCPICKEKGEHISPVGAWEIYDGIHINDLFQCYNCNSVFRYIDCKREYKLEWRYFYQIIKLIQIGKLPKKEKPLKTKYFKFNKNDKTSFNLSIYDDTQSHTEVQGTTEIIKL